MGKRVRTILSVLLAVVFCIGTGMLLRQKIQEKQAEAAYEQAQQLAASREEIATEPETTAPTEATQPPETQLPEMVWVPEPVEEDETVLALREIDLNVLRAENPNVVGWIRIPDTKVDYPLMQAEDNAFYLKHDWQGEKNVVGSIFMEKENSRDLTDFNTILYGHNLQSGNMFSALHDFDTPGFWEEHPYVYLVTDAGILRYEIFSTYNAPVESSTYRLAFRQEKTRVAFLEEAIANSLIDTGIVPATTDRILTLSTCTGLGYSSRRVVQARLKMMEVPAG